MKVQTTLLCPHYRSFPSAVITQLILVATSITKLEKCNQVHYFQILLALSISKSSIFAGCFGVYDQVILNIVCSAA